jgi:uncharacterized protein (TIGR02996 family)
MSSGGPETQGGEEARTGAESRHTGPGPDLFSSLSLGAALVAAYLFSSRSRRSRWSGGEELPEGPAMSQEQAFLEAIVESPADDLPRLAYADWLDEQGTPSGRARADFIRTQFAMEGLPPDDPRRPQLVERERELLVVHGEEWAAPLRERGMAEGWRFRRGFVEEVKISPEVLLAKGEELFQLAPVRCLGLVPRWSSDSTRLLARVSQSPLLARVEELDLPPFSAGAWEVAIEGLRALLARPTRLTALRRLRLPSEALLTLAPDDLPWLERLTELRLVEGQQWPEELQARMARGRLLMLRRLRLTRLELRNPSPEELRALARANFAGLTHLRLVAPSGLVMPVALGLPRLTSLNLAGCPLGDQDARQLAESLPHETLEELILASAHLGSRGIEALARSPHTTKLVRLDLSNNEFGPLGARALAASTTLPALTSLDLRNNRLGDEGIAELAPLLARLGSLRVSYNRITPAGLRRLAQAPAGRLHTLDLSWNALGDAGAEALAAWPGAATLTGLDLSYAELGDAAAEALARSPYLRSLAALNLGTNRIGPRGVRALAESSHLGSLTALNLGHNLRIGESGARALVESPLFRRLEALHLSDIGVPAAVLEELRSTFRGVLGG